MSGRQHILQSTKLKQTSKEYQSKVNTEKLSSWFLYYDTTRGTYDNLPL